MTVKSSTQHVGNSILMDWSDLLAVKIMTRSRLLQTATQYVWMVKLARSSVWCSILKWPIFFILQEYAAIFAGAGTNPGEKTLEDKFFEKEVGL